MFTRPSHSKALLIFTHGCSYDHEVHDHSTRSGAEIITNNYFDVGTAVQTYTLHTKGSNNKFGEKMIQKSGPLIWNSIPEYIQDAVSITSFKYLLKKHIFDQYDLDSTAENIYRRNYTNN